MFSTGRLSFKVPYPFTWFFTKKIPHYRESPGMGTHKHTRHSYLNSSISQCKNKKIKTIVLTQYRGAPRSSLVVIPRHLVAQFATNVLWLSRSRNTCISSSVLLLKSYKALCRCKEDGFICAVLFVLHLMLLYFTQRLRVPFLGAVATWWK